jgi:hypothetical protein
MVVRSPIVRWQVASLVALVGILAGQAPAANEAAAARMRKDIFFLASDACEGRGVTTQGINRAAEYIAGEFQKAGLKPGVPEGSYFQPFTMSGGARLESPNRLVLHGPLGQEIELKLGEHFSVLGLSGAGRVTAPVVFAGYGATAKEQGYDDYQGMDVAGKVVIVLRKTPRPDNPHTPFDGRSSVYHAALTTKTDNAERHQAAAVLFVSDRDTAKAGDPLMEFSYTAFGPAAKLPAVQVRRQLVDDLLQSSLGEGLDSVERAIDRQLKPHSALLTGWTASLEVNVRRVTTPVKNVVGVLEGSGPLADQTVVLGAHYDHLGYGGFGSLAPKAKGKIHYGADDNGSGTTALLELARRFGQRPNREGRRLVFIAFSGEESGLLGSEHYCKEPLFPLADTVAMINMDMVGRLRPDKETHKDKLIVYGTGTAKTFEKLIDGLNAHHGFQLQKIATGMGPSDQQSFYVKNIPVLFFFTGDHADYHRPTDTADKINLVGMGRVTDFVEELADRLRNDPKRPEFVRVKGEASGRMRMGGPRLGIMPSYGDDQEGVLLSGVSPGTPAAKADLKEGDRIVELAGKPVKNLEAYMALMAGQKKGDWLAVGILRGGKKMTITVTLE